jgi:hypothetical protein
VNLEEKWPVLGRHERAAEWLSIWTNLGRAPRTIDAYARGLAVGDHEIPQVGGVRDHVIPHPAIT